MILFSLPFSKKKFHSKLFDYENVVEVVHLGYPYDKTQISPIHHRQLGKDKKKAIFFLEK